VWGSGCVDPPFLDFGTSWRWVVSFTPRSLYPRGRTPRYPLDRRLSGPQSRFGRRGEEKILDPTGTRTPTPQSLYRLRWRMVPTFFTVVLVPFCQTTRCQLRRPYYESIVFILWILVNFSVIFLVFCRWVYEMGLPGCVNTACAGIVRKNACLHCA
jgi:hypothetical protein